MLHSSVRVIRFDLTTERVMVCVFKKSHPALKHGGYAATAVLPGERAAEFEKLHQDIIAELTPDGVIEDGIVATIARLVWCKHYLEIVPT